MHEVMVNFQIDFLLSVWFFSDQFYRNPFQMKCRWSERTKSRGSPAYCVSGSLTYKGNAWWHRSVFVL